MAAAIPRPDTSQLAAESASSAHPQAAAAEYANPGAMQVQPGRRGAAPHKWLIAISVVLGPILEVLEVQHFSVFDAWRMSNAAAYAPGTPVFHFVEQIVSGQRQGLGMVYRMIQQQSAMLAFNDIYRMLAVIALATIPSFALFQSAKPQPSGSAMH